MRYLNMFVLIGIALIGISVVGFATNNRFLTEPGQTVNPMAAFIYLGAGVLMLINGIVSIRMMPAVRKEMRASSSDANSPAGKEANSQI